MTKKVLLTATVQSHICQFHKPLVEILHTAGYEVHVAARNNLSEKNGLKLDFVDQVFNIPFARSPKSLDNLKAYKLLKKIIEKEKYNIVHCNTPMGGIVTRLAAPKARKQGLQVFYTAHGFHFYKGAPLMNWLVFYPIERWFSRITDKLITITHEDYELASKHMHCKTYRTHGVGVNEQRYKTATEQEKQDYRAKLGFSPTQKIILCVGELLPNKNQSMAIHMMQQLVKHYPDAILLLAGNGPEKQHIEELIKSTGLQQNVHMLGYVTNLQEYQHAADALVACSYREGLPLNVVEAMLSGNAVVASYNRGHRELIHDGETGYLVPINNAEAMSNRLLELFSNPSRKQYIEQAAQSYAQNYGFESVKQELQTIYGLR